MHLFSSTRERKLWIWMLVVVAAIYASLGLATSLADVLGSYGIVEPAFGLGVLLVAAAIVANGAIVVRDGRDIAVLLGVAAVYLLLFVRMGTFAERTHVVEYGVVALLIFNALRERKRHGRSVPLPAFMAIVATAVLGTIDECLQLFIPSRVFDSRDILVNIVAGIMAVSASSAIAWARKKRVNLS